MAHHFVAPVLLALSLLASPALACDQEDSIARLEKAVKEGILIDVNMLNNKPTAQIERGLWAEMPLTTRMRLLGTFDCALAGPGNLLREIVIISETGLVLAVWDGISKELDVRE